MNDNPKWVDTVSNAIEGSQLPLFPFQRRHVQHLANPETGGAIVCYATGNGKTLVAITTSVAFLAQNPGAKVHVVCPLSLIDNFKSGMVKYGLSADDGRYVFYTYEGFAKAYGRDMTITNGDMLICDEAHHIRTPIYTTLFAKLRKQTIKRGADVSNDPQHKAIHKALWHCQRTNCVDPLQYVLEETGFDITPLASRSLIVVSAAMSARKVLLLTATPIYNEPMDLLNLVSAAQRKGLILRGYFECILRSHNFLGTFQHLFIFRDIEEGDPDFPTLHEETVRIPMTQEYLTRYQNVERSNSLIFTKPWAFYTGVRQGTIGLEGNPKVQWTINKVLEGRKTLIFSSFITHGLKVVQALLQEMGIRFVEITGSTSRKNRTAAVQEFNSSSELNVLFVSAAGGEGLDLRGVRTIILMESEWNKPREDQVVGRGPRRGSHLHLPEEERNVHVYRLILTKPQGTLGKPSADEILEQIVANKEAVNVPVMIRLRAVSLA